MYFTSGQDRAFERLMQEKPSFDHYDGGGANAPEDCGSCRFYRPDWKYQYCVYAECPYQPGKLTAYDAVKFRVKGVENMAVFRVERNKGYTVMSNHHLRDKSLSLKAKGLLSLMLSLPEGWDYTTKGLARICKDGVDSICAGVRELEEQGYVIRERVRNANGQLGAIEYTILEQPRQPEPEREKPGRENPVQANPVLDNPVLGKPEQGNPAQLNTNQVITNERNNSLRNYQSINLDGMDRMDEREQYRELIRDNLEIDIRSQDRRYDLDRAPQDPPSVSTEKICRSRWLSHASSSWTAATSTMCSKR